MPRESLATAAPHAAAFTGNAVHLSAELELLALRLEREVLRLQAAGIDVADHHRGLYVPDRLAAALLVSRNGSPPADPSPQLSARIDELALQLADNVRMASGAGADLRLPRLARDFGLSPFEAHVLAIAAAPELDARFETLCSYAQNDVTRKRPTIDLVLRLLCDGLAQRLERYAAFSAAGPLLRHRLLELPDDPQHRHVNRLSLPLKLDARVIEFLTGLDNPDARLLPWTRLLHPRRRLPDLCLPSELIVRLAAAVRFVRIPGPALLFRGPPGVGKKTAAEALCTLVQVPLLVADLRALPLDRGQAHELWALLRREALLQRAVVYLDRFERLAPAEHLTTRLALMRELSGLPVIVAASDQPGGEIDFACERPVLAFAFAMPSREIRARLWRDALSSTASIEPAADPAALAESFTLTPAQISQAVGDAVRGAQMRGQSTVSQRDLHAAARGASSGALQMLARKVPHLYTWSDIILPPRAFEQLREICHGVRHRRTVHETWAFGSRLANPSGLNVLFSGPSGTGKTMAAQVVARDLGLDLYRIDLSTVVSKYIGETEKNLSAVFREAQCGNAILLFDEADALFGKRSEVQDAHDRYANIEVAFLLQRLEEYEGIVILTTNLSRNIDDAFNRRMHHALEFPFPDAPSRERIWAVVFPPEAPLDSGVDLPFLARQFELSGGNIRNIALAAAFFAAEQGSAILMEHVIRATSRELAKSHKLPSKADFRGYYEMIRDR